MRDFSVLPKIDQSKFAQNEEQNHDLFSNFIKQHFSIEINHEETLYLMRPASATADWFEQNQRDKTVSLLQRKRLMVFIMQPARSMIFIQQYS